MLSNHLFLVIIFTIILIVFAEYQKLRNITWILVIGCVTYVVLMFMSNIDTTKPQNNIKLITESDSLGVIVISELISEENTVNEVINIDTASVDKTFLDQSIINEPIKSRNLKAIAVSRNIVDKNPVDVSRLFLNNIDALYCFTAVDNPFNNNKIIHTWEYNGQNYLKSYISIGESAYWRCWSRITIRPEMTGDWKVTVTDTIGNYLDSIEFSIISTDE